jgi:membrane associated rhomboid family serine protease
VRSARPSTATRAKYWNASQNVLVTRTIIAINIVVYFWTVAGNREFDLGLSKFYIDNGEYYRIISSGFLHFSILHVGMNMFLLWQLGQLLESAMGRVRFTSLYFICMIGGAIGALILEPNALTGGASGAVFGLMAAAAVGLHQRGVNPFRTGIGTTLILNLVITFAIPGISIGGHLGGALTGAALGYVMLKPRWR